MFANGSGDELTMLFCAEANKPMIRAKKTKRRPREDAFIGIRFIPKYSIYGHKQDESESEVEVEPIRYYWDIHSLKKGQKKSPTKAGLYEGFGNDILSQVLPKYHLLGGA